MKTTPVVIIIILYVSLICSLHAQDNWAGPFENPMFNKRYGAAGFSIGNKGYVGSGRRELSGGSIHTYNDIWEYDQDSNVWQQKASLGTPNTNNRYRAVGFSIGSKGYIGTGLSHGGGTNFNDLLEYDPETNTWTNKANFPGGGRFDAVGFSIGGKGYIGTGHSISGELDRKDFYEYDPTTNIWTQKADFQGPARGQATGFSICDKGYIGTGYGGGAGGARMDDFWEYDPNTNTWTEKAPYGGGLTQDAVSFSICTRGFVFKGHYTREFWEYNPSSDVWSRKRDFVGEARIDAVGFSIGQKGYLGTGRGFAFEYIYYGELYAYTLSSNNVPDQPGEIAGMESVCAGSVQIFHVDALPCATAGYTWNVPVGSTILSGEGTDSIVVQIGNLSGDIRVTADNTCGQSQVRTRAITVNPIPVLGIEGAITMCEGDSVNLSASGANIFSWSPALGLNNSNIANPIASPTTTTTYQVIGTSNSCSDTASITIEVLLLPIVEVEVEGETTICQGESVILTTNDGLASYDWSTGETTKSITVSPTITTAFNVTGTSINGCTDTAIVTITVNPTPETPDPIIGKDTLCLNEEVEYSVAGSPGVSYSWNLPQGWSSLGLMGSTITTFAGQSGIISISANQGICISDTTFLDVKVYAQPSIPELIISKPELCRDSTYTFAVASHENAQYFNWQIPPGWTRIDSNAFSIKIIPDVSGTLKVSAGNDCFPPSPELQYDVIVLTSPPETPGPVIGENMVCAGSIQNYFVSSNQMDGTTTYEWALPGGGWAPVSGISDSLISYKVGESNVTLRVRGKNECGFSTFSTPFPVTVLMPPDTTVEEANGSLTSQEQNGTYQWLGCEPYIEIPGAESQSFTPSLSGWYAVAVSNAGCTDTSDCHFVDISTSIYDPGPNGEVQIYPNPTSSYINVLSKELPVKSISVFNSLGQLVLESRAVNILTVEIDMNRQPSGIYTIALNMDDHYVVKKIIKH